MTHPKCGVGEGGLTAREGRNLLPWLAQSVLSWNIKQSYLSMASSNLSDPKPGPSKGKWFVPWVVRPKNLYLIHAGEFKENLNPSGELLAECTTTGRLSGGFRWAFGGGSANAGFGLRCVVDFEEAPAFFININMKPDEIEIRNNNTSGKWSDLADWIAEEKVSVSSNDESTEMELLGKEFSFSSKFIHQEILTKSAFGIHI